MRFGFVLLGRPGEIDVAAVANAHRRLNPSAPHLEASEPQDPSNPEVVTLRFADSHGDVIVGVMPAAIPNREADGANDFSIGRFQTDGRPLGPHAAHAIVTVAPWDGSTPVAHMVRLTWALAAVADATGAVGVYWGTGGVSHTAELFLSFARDVREDQAMLPLWSGVSVAQQRGGASLLTLGVNAHFGLPDLMVWAPKGKENDGLGLLFDLASYVVSRGEPIPAGDTVGGTSGERLAVRYERSPLDRDKQVMCVDLPGRRRWFPFGRR